MKSPLRHLPALLLLIGLLTPIPGTAQGCTQCRDNTASTSPATEQAYRRAILLMTTAAASFFVVTLVIFKRNR